jgi:Flp pilus assembly pilin Flp
LARLAREDEAGDLIEYGLLIAAVAAAGAALLPDILTAMQALVEAWVPAVNDSWIPPDPLP